ncbi:hypothetical protein HDU98_001476 [Podochytrium sp. JEL0797]|nr:hypothetical protein HDU98_001476 [Podochytrium sp. JEL0797]
MATAVRTTTFFLQTTEVVWSKNLPDEEKPILDQLMQFRHSLQSLRKESRGALTLSDVNAKAKELSNIVNTLHETRNATSMFIPAPRNRVDTCLDTIWMSMFYLWDKLVAIDSSLYPVYVSLVTLARTTESLRLSGAWTPDQVEPLHLRLRHVDEQVAACEGKFVAQNLSGVDTAVASLGDKIPMGQAVLVSLQNRIHRTIGLLVTENESVAEELMPLKCEVEGIFGKLSELEKKGVDGYSLEALAPLSKRLHSIDASKGTTGNFCNSDAQYGHATISGLLNASFDKLSLLVANLDPVPPTSPLYPTARALLEIHAELMRIYANATTRSDPGQLSLLLESTQSKLHHVELQRVNGTFVPAGESFDHAVKLPGQASLHKLLHDCHAVVTKLVDPVSLPVGEALVSTYELLMKQRTTLRKLRAWSFAGWNVAAELSQVQEVLKTVEAGRVKGLFVGVASRQQVAENADFGDAGEDEEMDMLQNGVPDGQAAVSALVDECDSLVWQVACRLEAQ